MTNYALIAEPDKDQAAFYQKLVVEEGLEPVVVGNCDEAKSILRDRGLPALLITNLSLPYINGFTLLDELRRVEPAEKTPVLAVAPFVKLRDSHANLTAELGVTEIIGQRSDPELVRRAVRRALTSGRATEPAKPGGRRAAGSLGRSGAHSSLASVHMGEDLFSDDGLRRLVEDVAQAFGVAIALIVLQFEGRNWFQLHIGSRSSSQLRRETLRQWDVPGLTPSLVQDPARLLAAIRPLVGDTGARCYAGAPIVAPTGEVLGTICIMDSNPLAAGSEQADNLVLLARRLSGELEQRRSRLLKAREDSYGQLRRSGSLAEEDLSALSYLETLLDRLDSGILLVDGEGSILFANQVLCEMVGLPAERIVNMRRRDFIRHNVMLFDDPSDYLRKLQVPDEGPFVAREEFELQRPRRRVIRWIAKPVQFPSLIGQLEIFTDITAEVDLAERELLALTDPVTGLTNRRGGEGAIARELARVRRSELPLSFAMFDVDYFKRVNDTHGHPAGDKVLREIAGVLTASYRGSDLAVRWGGDEMLVVLPAVGVEGARTFAERVRAAVERLDLARVGRVTISAGVAELQSGEDPQAAIARADGKLYEAKFGGRNLVR